MFKREASILSKREASILSSSLHDQDSFYRAFLDDLRKARRQVIIESPFITIHRTNKLIRVLRILCNAGVEVIVNTKPPEELDTHMAHQANSAIVEFQAMGIKVLYTTGHHRKLAIVDGMITWEGSLNILSQNDSCELMRRIDSKQISEQMLSFINIHKFVA